VSLWKSGSFQRSFAGGVPLATLVEVPDVLNVLRLKSSPAVRRESHAPNILILDDRLGCRQFNLASCSEMVSKSNKRFYELPSHNSRQILGLIWLPPGSAAPMKTPIYYCDNTFPRGTDLSSISQAQLDQVSLRLNQRPRKTLGFQTPASRLQASIALSIRTGTALR
jgi:hypothetical protein